MDDESNPNWLNSGDNAWQLTAATLVALQSMPGLILLFGGAAPNKWRLNATVMAVYAFAATLICWTAWGYRMSFGDEMAAFLGKPGAALDSAALMRPAFAGSFPTATMVWFQFVFAAITPILIGGAVAARMRFAAWMAVVPLWHTCCYTIGAYSVWNPKGWLARLGVVDFAGGFVIHVSSGVAGFVAAYWVGPRSDDERKNYQPNNPVMMVAGAALLWVGWTGFNGGAPYAASALASLAVINTHICAAAAMLTWLMLDIAFCGKSSAIGVVNGIISGLVCITPAAGVVECWAAMLMGLISGTIPWYTLTLLPNKLRILRHVDDTFAIFHTHAVAGALGSILTGLLAVPKLCKLFYNSDKYVGLAYAIADGRTSAGLRQMGLQFLGLGFIVCLNGVVTTLICLLIRVFVPLRLSEEELKVGDEVLHGDHASWSNVDEGDNNSRILSCKVNIVYDVDDIVSKTPTYEMYKV